MHFTLCFFACLFFIHSWTVNQILGKRSLTLTSFDCKSNKLFCAVQITVKEGVKIKNQTMVVLQSLLNEGIGAHRSIAFEKTVQNWMYTCKGQFCFGVLKTPGSPWNAKMNLPDPMVDKDRIVITSFNLNQLKLENTGFPVPNFSFFYMPTFTYDCEQRNKCEIRISAFHGGPEYAIQLPYNEEQHTLNTFQSFMALNGVGACFDKHCVFVDAHTLEVYVNFNYFYSNMPSPEPLRFTANNEVDLSDLISAKSKTPVQVEMTFDGSDRLTLHFTYLEVQTDSIETKSDLLKVKMAIPDSYKEDVKNRVRHFLAQNGVGACAGDFCCFKRDQEPQLLVNFEDSNYDFDKSWVSNDYRKPIEGGFDYGGPEVHEGFYIEVNGQSVFVRSESSLPQPVPSTPVDAPGTTNHSGTVRSTNPSAGGVVTQSTDHQDKHGSKQGSTNELPKDKVKKSKANVTTHMAIFIFNLVLMVFLSLLVIHA